MSAQTKQSKPDDLAANVAPIEFLTENGFSILRRWEVDGVPPPVNRKYAFIVRQPSEPDQEIVVTISVEVIVDVEVRTQQRIQRCSSFWICCAERHLAEHLWEKDACPPGNELLIDCLNPDDVISALRWRI